MNEKKLAQSEEEDDDDDIIHPCYDLKYFEYKRVIRKSKGDNKKGDQINQSSSSSSSPSCFRFSIRHYENLPPSDAVGLLSDEDHTGLLVWEGATRCVEFLGRHLGKCCGNGDEDGFVIVPTVSTAVAVSSSSSSSVPLSVVASSTTTDSSSSFISSSSILLSQFLHAPNLLCIELGSGVGLCSMFLHSYFKWYEQQQKNLVLEKITGEGEKKRDESSSAERKEGSKKTEKTIVASQGGSETVNGNRNGGNRRFIVTDGDAECVDIVKMNITAAANEEEEAKKEEKEKETVPTTCTSSPTITAHRLQWGVLPLPSSILSEIQSWYSSSSSATIINGKVEEGGTGKDDDKAGDTISSSVVLLLSADVVYSISAIVPLVTAVQQLVNEIMMMTMTMKKKEHSCGTTTTSCSSSSSSFVAPPGKGIMNIATATSTSCIRWILTFMRRAFTEQQYQAQRALLRQTIEAQGRRQQPSSEKEGDQGDERKEAHKGKQEENTQGKWEIEECIPILSGDDENVHDDEHFNLVSKGRSLRGEIYVIRIGLLSQL